MKEHLNIGLFGYGNVGQGVYRILEKSKSVKNSIVKIGIKHIDKKRNLSPELFTTNQDAILNNPDINLIVEAINDAEAAFEILKKALTQGKDVVTANKKMVAEHLQEIIELQKETGKSVLYEASACSSIPIIRTLEEYYDNDTMQSIGGIFNSSSNYILTKIFKENRDYDIALKQAQDLGFAETNSNLDIMGLDALHKLIIITSHAFGVIVDAKKVVYHGIQNISRFDIEYAKERNLSIKQMAVVKKLNDHEIALYVLPQFIAPENRMHHVDLEYNAVLIDANHAGLQYMDGKGAGGFPTGSAVMSDISANTYHYKYEYKKYYRDLAIKHSNNLKLEVYLRYFDKKNLDLFEFEKINARYESKEFNYVVGNIKLEKLLAANNKINTADILIVSTGKYITD